MRNLSGTWCISHQMGITCSLVLKVKICVIFFTALSLLKFISPKYCPMCIPETSGGLWKHKIKNVVQIKKIVYDHVFTVVSD